MLLFWLDLQGTLVYVGGDWRHPGCMLFMDTDFTDASVGVGDGLSCSH